MDVRLQEEASKQEAILPMHEKLSQARALETSTLHRVLTGSLLLLDGNGGGILVLGIIHGLC